jgi:cytidylate kinase
MPVITVSGEIGSGAREIGPLVAEYAGIDYVDRLVLAEAGRRVGVSVARLAEREQRVTPFREKLAKVLQTALERSAVTGGSTDPFFQPSVEALLVQAYPETSREASSERQGVDVQRFVGVIAQVMKELANDNHVVILGRAANMVLANWPGVFHACIMAPHEYRVQTMMRREGLPHTDAEKLLAAQEKARQAHYRRFYKVDANDPLQYHVTLNSERVGIETAARIIVKAAEIKRKG